MTTPVLLVDPDTASRTWAAAVLKSAGHPVAQTANAAQARAAQARHQCPVVVIDPELPDMDGYELLDHVRADARLRHVPVVMITSRAGQKHRRKARKAGANAYLTKPYREPELIETVNRLLAGREQKADE